MLLQVISAVGRTIIQPTKRDAVLDAVLDVGVRSVALKHIIVWKQRAEWLFEGARYLSHSISACPPASLGVTEWRCFLVQLSPSCFSACFGMHLLIGHVNASRLCGEFCKLTCSL
jgi:hypothetical protein